MALGEGKPEEAERHVRAALAIRRDSIGADSPEAAACLCFLADVLLELGRHG